MNDKFPVFLTSLGCVLPVACGNDSSPADTTESASADPVQSIATREELPDCDASSEGALFLVSADGTLSVCTDGEYLELSAQGEPGATGTDGLPGQEGDAGPDGGSGSDGSNGSDGLNATDPVVEVEEPGDNCPVGGVRITNGSTTTYVCDGEDSPSLLVTEPIVWSTQFSCLTGEPEGAGGAGGAGAGTGREGNCFNWLGSLDVPPTAPEESDAFYFTRAGTACIWDGAQWAVMAQADNPRPGGCSPYTRVFTPIGTFSPDFGGVSGADAICQERADAAALGGEWRAWISDSLGNSPSVNFDHQPYPYKRLDGVTVADNWDDLADASHAAHAAVTPYGSSNYGRAWTGTENSGTPAANNCQNWTVTSGANARVGLTAQIDTRWSAIYNLDCGEVARLYCFEQ